MIVYIVTLKIINLKGGIADFLRETCGSPPANMQDKVIKASLRKTYINID